MTRSEHSRDLPAALDAAPLAALEHGVPFADRHIGPDAADLTRMLAAIGVGSLEELADTAMPSSIRSDPADWGSTGPHDQAPPPPATESEVLDELRGYTTGTTNQQHREASRG